MGTVHDACTAPPLPPGRTPDGQWPNDRQVSCYWPAHKPLLDLGVDGWWPDQGDGYDLPRGWRAFACTSKATRCTGRTSASTPCTATATPACRAMPRSCGRATVSSLWETLRNQCPSAINTGLSGIPYWGTDIGGFVPTAEFTGELYVRWFQFAAFSPLFRSHGRVWTLRLPWGWNQGAPSGDVAAETRFTIPEAEYHNAAVEPICRNIWSCATALMPYLYSAVRECYANRHAGDARAVAALSRRPRRRGARRRIPLGPRHPGRAGGGERRDLAQALPAARRLVRFLDEREARRRRRNRRARWISRPSRSTCAPARSSPWGR